MGKPNLLRRYFSGVAEHTFQTKLGVADPPLVDYLSDLLVRFVRNDMMYRVRTLAGRPIHEVADMVGEADHRIGPAKRDVHRHIGDFTLFWSGVYPEALDKMRGPSKRDHLVDYCSQGKRAYWIASTIETDKKPTGDVLERLSESFEMCAYGLREVRKQWENDAGSHLPIIFE